MELEGKYPKEFEFVGWHPHCRCHAIPILEKPEDFLKRQQALQQGQHVPPLRAVKQPPKNFLQHLKDNQDRLQQANKRGTLPYFIRDNYKVSKKGELTPIFTSNPTTLYKGAFKGLPKEQNAIPQQTTSYFKDVQDKLQEATKPFVHYLYCAFDPFSPMIIEAVRMAQDRKAKNAIFESILNDERASVLYQTQTAKTTIFPNHKGKRSPVGLRQRRWHKTSTTVACQYLF